MQKKTELQQSAKKNSMQWSYRVTAKNETIVRLSNDAAANPIPIVSDGISQCKSPRVLDNER